MEAKKRKKNTIQESVLMLLIQLEFIFSPVFLHRFFLLHLMDTNIVQKIGNVQCKFFLERLAKLRLSVNLFVANF